MKFSSIEFYISGHANKGQSRDLKGVGPPFFNPGSAKIMKIKMIIIASSILLLAHTNFNKSQKDKVAI